jgi:hypothetical protein
MVGDEGGGYVGSPASPMRLRPSDRGDPTPRSVLPGFSHPCKPTVHAAHGGVGGLIVPRSCPAELPSSRDRHLSFVTRLSHMEVIPREGLRARAHTRVGRY